MSLELKNVNNSGYTELKNLYNSGYFSLAFSGSEVPTTTTTTSTTTTTTTAAPTTTTTTTTTSTTTSTTTVAPTTTSTTTTTTTSGVTDQLRAQLTTSTSSYDAASVGSWVKITAAEYNRITGSITGATKKGNSDAQIATRSVLTSYTNQQIAFGTGSTPSFQINTGEYVIAMITEAWNQTSGSSYLSYTTAFTGSVVGSIGGAAGPSSGGTRDYFVRKAPTDIATETRYPTLLMTVSPNAVLNWSGYRSTNSGSSWIGLPNNQIAKIQIVTTLTKSW